MKYVILGNSAAAVSAVDAIRSLDATGRITMVSPEVDRAYGTPLISYILEGKTDEERAEIRSREWYERNGVDALFGPGCAAVGIGASEKTVTLEDGTTLPYDKLLVAMGSVPLRPQVAGLADDAPNSFFFNTMDDARAIRACLDGPLAAKRATGQPVRAVVSGSGLIGTKAAEGLAAHVDTVYLVGHAARPLRKLLDDQGAQLLVDVFERHGIVNVPSAVVESVECDEAGAVSGVLLSNGEQLPCDLLVTAVGVRPNAGILEQAGALCERGAVCDAHMMTTLPDVYAAGDVANVHNVLLGADAPLALWPVACEQGRVAGRAMAGDADACFPGSCARNAVGFFGEIDILGCGIIDPSCDLPDVETVVSTGDGWLTRFNIREGKLVGYVLVNKPEGAGIYTSIVEQGMPLASLPDDVLERVPALLDLPRAFRDAQLMQGFPGRREA